jgi:CRISPR-associated protein Cmr1
MLKLTLDFEVLTPLYLGDADGKRAELRPPSFKGALRFWYRAADPEFRKHESDFFGGAGEGKGQSALLLAIDEKSPLTVRWESFKADRFKSGRGKETRNGLVYLGFPLQMAEGRNREAIRPGHRFTLTAFVPRSVAKMARFRQAVAASFWLLAHFGAMGSRARRGFGVLGLHEWTAEGEWPEVGELPLVSRTATVEAARAALERGLARIREWFGQDWGTNEKRPHPHLGPAFRHKLVARSDEDWAEVLAAMGAEMQRFRSRRAPDYQQVKDELARTRPLDQAPERASFGLPLSFRYSSLRGKGTMVLPWAGEGRKPHERHGSLLFLRLMKVGGRLHPHYVRMDGDVPGFAPPAVLRGARRPLKMPARNAMDEFFNEIEMELR